MKVNIGPYVDWIGPYQIAEKILFWMDKDEDDRVHNFGKWLAGDKKDTLLTKLCQWIHNKQKRKIKVHIDYYDVWSADHTLALIILPTLKKLKEVKHGSPYVDLEDVPESMRLISHPDYDSQKTFEFYHEPNLQNIQCDVHDRWNWALDEMIFAFECLVDDSWEDAYRSGEHDIKHVPCEWDENGKAILYRMEKGPNDTYKCDYEGMQKVQDRIDNGFVLFGKYYRGLWD